MNEKLYFVYVLRCFDDSLYTGITTDVKRRFDEHCGNSGLGAKYTRSRKPKSIEAVWSTKSRADASRLEYIFKHLPKHKKELIISVPDTFEQLLCDKLNTDLYNYTNEYN